MAHRSINLQLGVDKPGNIYRYIYNWRSVPSNHGDSTFYLMLHALVEWNGRSENVFFIAMQYSTNIGENVDISQPAHILEQDVHIITTAWAEFIRDTIANS